MLKDHDHYDSLLEQCDNWIDEDDYEPVIESLEAIPEENRTEDVVLTLAQAYNNYALEVDDLGFLERTVDLLMPYEDELSDNPAWNFRLGYAFYFLDEECKALPYMKAFLQMEPDDEDGQFLYNECLKQVSVPRFEEPFKARTAEAWQIFMEHERALRKMLDGKPDSNELVELVHESLDVAFDEVSFEIGKNSAGIYELIFTLEGDRVRLFPLAYFCSKAPDALRQHWRFMVGRQPQPNHKVELSDGFTLGVEDVMCRLDEDEDGDLMVQAYSEKLLPLLNEEHEASAHWVLGAVMSLAIGEVPALMYLSNVSLSDKPILDAQPLTALAGMLEARGLTVTVDPKALFDQYVTYQRAPSGDVNLAGRSDVVVGSTNCVPVLAAFLKGDPVFMDALYADGIVPGFVAYSLEAFHGDTQALSAFRQALKEHFSQPEFQDILIMTGGAEGLYAGYFDFIAWDLEALIEPMCAFLKEHGITEASFHTFRQGVRGLTLVSSEDEDDAFGGEEEDIDFADIDFEDDDDDIDDDFDDVDDEDDDAGDIAEDAAGRFLGLVLLDKPVWDKTDFIRRFEDEWGIKIEEEVEEDEEPSETYLSFKVGTSMVVISLMNGKVPNGEAEYYAQANYLWDEAEAAAERHCAHLIVAVLDPEGDFIEMGKLYSKCMATAATQKHVTALFPAGIVVEPQYYIDMASFMHNDDLPVPAWIWIGLRMNEEGVSGYTYGMTLFGKDEMEVVNAEADPMDVHQFLLSLAAYVLTADLTLKDGETVGLSDTDKRRITRSPGELLPTEQMTLKVSWS